MELERVSACWYKAKYLKGAENADGVEYRQYYTKLKLDGRENQKIN